ncbi:MAG: hypothetical protein GWP19_03450 [Planctomycetia bacterium]|nr:hypothetical protein [Planctomycetia bacterium]
MNKKNLLISLTVLIVVIAIFFFWQFTKSPKYSLMQVNKSFKQHDLVKFEKYVDVEGITDNIIDQALESDTKDDSPTDLWAKIGEGLVMLLKPQLSKIAKQEVAKLVETGNIEIDKTDNDSEDYNFSLSEYWNLTKGEKAEFKGIDYIKKEGKIALVGINIFQKEYETDLIIELKMRDKGNYWQIAQINNFNEFVGALDSLKANKIDKLNKPIIKAMEQSLSIEEIRKSTKTDDWGFSKNIVLSTKVKNISKKQIVKYTLSVTLTKLDGEELKKISIIDEHNITSGKIRSGQWSIDANMFIDKDNILFDTPHSKLNIQVNIKLIEFEDGQILELQEYN